MAKLSTKNFELQESVHSPAHNCGAVPPPPPHFFLLRWAPSRGPHLRWGEGFSFPHPTDLSVAVSLHSAAAD